mmetsp:Transcript_23580/g.59277  ORF Transcript_23580/g.59277 Transcript_23580/m.59277 type:complete len:267 (+) Transcript_23580:381-1181(+)
MSSHSAAHTVAPRAGRGVAPGLVVAGGGAAGVLHAVVAEGEGAGGARGGRPAAVCAAALVPAGAVPPLPRVGEMRLAPPRAVRVRGAVAVPSPAREKGKGAGRAGRHGAAVRGSHALRAGAFPPRQPTARDAAPVGVPAVVGGAGAVLHAFPCEGELAEAAGGCAARTADGLADGVGGNDGVAYVYSPRETQQAEKAEAGEPGRARGHRRSLTGGRVGHHKAPGRRGYSWSAGLSPTAHCATAPGKEGPIAPQQKEIQVLQGFHWC